MLRFSGGPSGATSHRFPSIEIDKTDRHFQSDSESFGVLCSTEMLNVDHK